MISVAGDAARGRQSQQAGGGALGAGAAGAGALPPPRLPQLPVGGAALNTEDPPSFYLPVFSGVL